MSKIMKKRRDKKKKKSQGQEYRESKNPTRIQKMRAEALVGGKRETKYA